MSMKTFYGNLGVTTDTYLLITVRRITNRTHRP